MRTSHPWLQTIAFTGILGIFTGCAHLDRLGTKMEMLEDRAFAQEDQFIYEGQLERVRAIGEMTALQFTDGRLYDVFEAPDALMSGDTVRIYKRKQGYEARLWKTPANQKPIAVSLRSKNI